MVRSPGTGAGKALGNAGGGSTVVMNKGPWTEAEDRILSAHMKAHGEGNWRLIPKLAGLARCGKSCRLRWINYLHPNLKRGNFSLDEDNLILTLHALLGNRWSLISGRIPGRTDNDIKNYWNSHLRRKLRSLGIDPMKYKVGLTLTTNTNPQQSNAALDPSPSSSSPTELDQLKNHTKTITTSMANSQLVSSPSNSTSTSTSYESVSGDSVPGGSQLQLQEFWSSVGNSNNLQSSINPCLVDQEGHLSRLSGWDYDQFRMEHLQLLDPLEFAGPGTGIMQPLEAVPQAQVGKWSTASGSLLDAHSWID